MKNLSAEKKELRRKIRLSEYALICSSRQLAAANTPEEIIYWQQNIKIIGKHLKEIEEKEKLIK